MRYHYTPLTMSQIQNTGCVNVGSSLLKIKSTSLVNNVNGAAMHM